MRLSTFLYPPLHPPFHILRASFHHHTPPPAFPLHLLTHTRTLTASIWQAALTRTQSLIAIDATAGRGSDTLTLAQLIHPQAQLHAIDVQAAALDETRLRYAQQQYAQPDAQAPRLHLWHMGHEHMSRLGLQAASVGVVAYNLGWYPAYNADRRIITKGETTVASLQVAAQLVSRGGVITVMMYLGHAGGSEEADMVKTWAADLCREWQTSLIAFPNRDTAPELLICQRGPLSTK